MTVNTSKFVASHGKAPRGYGMWGFVPEAKWSDDNYLESVMWHTGTYAEAKQRAVAFFAPRGVSSVVVCP